MIFRLYSLGVEFDRLTLSENNTFDPWPNRGEPR